MGDDNDVFLSKPVSIIEHLTVVFEHQPFIGIRSWEGLVEAAAVFSHGDAKGSESFLAGTVENLKRGMRRHDSYGERILVVAFKPTSHGIERYAHMEGFRNRSMSIMLAEDVQSVTEGPRR